MTWLDASLLRNALLLGIVCATSTFALAEPSKNATNTPAPGEQLWAAWGGTVGVRWNRELAADIGLAIETPTGRLDGLSWREHERFDLRQSGSLEFHVANNNLQAFAGGSLQARGGYVIKVRDGSIDLTDFRLRPRKDDPLILDMLGADGKVWFYIDRLMYELVDENRTLAVRTMDVRISRELAQRIGHPVVADWPIADMEMTTEVLRQGPGLVPTGTYKWAGTTDPNGNIYRADLFMSTFTVAGQSRCEACTGSSATSRVVFTPSSTLKNNVNNGTQAVTIPNDPLGTSSALYTADIPWWRKFTGNHEPYGNDQHPFLIWNLYRFNPDGTIDQIGRSGVKHAFVSTNTGCLENPGTGNVLGRGCSDTYGTGNNDSNNDLGPRSEILAATNQWGRCGSIYDLNCDGVANTSGNGQYSQRLIVAESQIVSSLQPGATYLFESWYLAREDVNIYNSMATKTVVPAWSGSVWSLGGGNNYRLGPAINRWVDPTNPGANARNVELASSEGHAQVAVKATDLGGGSWRYDYVIMNHDFARAVTEGSEPNLRVIHNFGFDEFRVALPTGTTVSDVRFSDGDLVAGNDWSGSASGEAITWAAPVNATPPANTPAVLNPLNWGTMFRFSFVANAAPADAEVALHVAQAGDPALLTATLIGPSISDLIYADGFEDPKD